MKKTIYKIFIVSFCFICSLPLGGCKPIFKKQVDKYQQVELTKDELSTETYYIKDGTKFVAVYNANTSSVNDSGRQRSVCFLTVDYKTVPTLYKDEIIAISSSNTSVSAIDLIRYKEIGYTIGAFGLSEDTAGYYCGTLNKNIYPNSNLYTIISQNGKSDKFRIITLNDQPVSVNMFSDTGVFNCMEKDQSYSFTYYAGTYYTSGTAIADTFTLEEYEYYSLTQAENTKNGYVAFSMPEDAKSGWYYIKGKGLFRYIAEKKGVNVDEINMNEPYYTSEEEQLSYYSQKFSTSFDTRMLNVSLLFSYSIPQGDNTITDETISGVAYAPDGTSYEMIEDSENHLIRCDLDEAMAGKWTVYITPKELIIEDMDVVSNKNAQEITEEIYPFNLEEERTNYKFKVSYEGDGDIYAILIDEEEKMYEFSTDTKNHILSYTAPYISPGNYTVKVYHYTDTNILAVTTEENTKTESDIITVTE